MALYSLAVRTAAGTIAVAGLEIGAGANVGYRLLELGLTLNAATASVFGLGTPGAIGLTPTNVAALAEDGGNTAAANTNGIIAWSSTVPTVPANFFRRLSTPATIGAGIIWTFPRGIITLKAKTQVLWHITAVSVADVWFVVDE